VLVLGSVAPVEGGGATAATTSTGVPIGASSIQVRPGVSSIGVPVASEKIVGAGGYAFAHVPRIS
jgi:hypothetical protein